MSLWVCLAKISSRSNSHRISNIPLDLLWSGSPRRQAGNIVTFGRKLPLKNQTGISVGTGRRPFEGYEKYVQSIYKGIQAS